MTARDFQFRSVQWLQGKTFERSTPVGPWLVTDAEPGEISCTVDGDVVQKADTADLVFSPGRRWSPTSRRSSRWCPATSSPPAPRAGSGTPASRRATSPRARELVTRVEGVGELRNAVRRRGPERCASPSRGADRAGCSSPPCCAAADPSIEVTVFERNRADDTFGFGVVFSDRTLAGIHEADPVLREALTEHGRHWDEIEVRLKGERIRCGGNGMAAVVRKTLLALMQARARDVGARAAVLHRGRAWPTSTGYDLVVAADGADSRIRGAARRRGPRRDGRDRDGEVHLVRHRLPVRRADLRPRARPGRGVRRARLPDLRRRSPPSSSRPTRSPGARAGLDEFDVTQPPGAERHDHQGVPGEAVRRADRRQAAADEQLPVGQLPHPPHPALAHHRARVRSRCSATPSTPPTSRSARARRWRWRTRSRSPPR